MIMNVLCNYKNKCIIYERKKEFANVEVEDQAHIFNCLLLRTGIYLHFHLIRVNDDKQHNI